MNPPNLDLSHVAVHRLFCGMSGKGKSTLVRSIVSRSRAPWQFAFETFKREYSAPPPHGLRWRRCIDDPGLRAAVAAGQPSAFYGAPLFEGNPVEAFNFWIRWVWNVGRQLEGVKNVIIEEIEATTAHRNTPLHPAFSAMLNEGRAAGFDVYVIAQTVSRTNEFVRAALTEVTTFQITDPDQVDWLRRERFPVEAVEKLERGEWIARNRETGQVTTNVRPGRRAAPAPAVARPPRPFHNTRNTKTGQFIPCKNSTITRS